MLHMLHGSKKVADEISANTTPNQRRRAMKRMPLLVAIVAAIMLFGVTGSAFAADSNNVLPNGAPTKAVLISEYETNASARALFNSLGVTGAGIAEARTHTLCASSSITSYGRETTLGSTEVRPDGHIFFKRSLASVMKGCAEAWEIHTKNGTIYILKFCGNPEVPFHKHKPKPKHHKARRPKHHKAPARAGNCNGNNTNNGTGSAGNCGVCVGVNVCNTTPSPPATPPGCATTVSQPVSAGNETATCGGKIVNICSAKGVANSSECNTEVVPPPPPPCTTCECESNCKPPPKCPNGEVIPPGGGCKNGTETPQPGQGETPPGKNPPDENPTSSQCWNENDPTIPVSPVWNSGTGTWDCPAGSFGS